MTDLFLSLAVLARDPEGSATLERALRSALERPDGPMFDEVVVVYGGRPNVLCQDLVYRIRSQFASVEWRDYHLPADVPLTETGGLADFAAARNFLYSRCRGVWIAYIDADDVIPAAPPGGAPTVTLRAFLKGLPPAFNSMSFAYHYAHDHLGNVLTATSREWVRWRDGWSWVNRAPGHHEALFPIYPNQRNVADLTGFYLEHRPPNESAAMRTRRNDALLDAARQIHLSDPWGVSYYMARQAERANLFAKAVGFDEECLTVASNDEEKYTTFHMLARNLRYLGRYPEALTAAFHGYDQWPTRPEAIADAVLINLDKGDPERAVVWYDRLIKLPPAPAAVGGEYSAYEAVLWPHVAASKAFTMLKRFYDARDAAKRAIAFAPYDVGAQMVLRAAQAGLELEEAKAAARVLLEFAAHHDDAARVAKLAANLPYVLENDQDIRSIAARVEHATSAAVADTSTAKRLRAETPRPAGYEVLVVPYGVQTPRVAHWPVHTPARLLELLDSDRILRLERVGPDETDQNRGDTIVAVYPLHRERERGDALPPDRPEVSIFCPEYIEAWGPFTAERTGIGGSEEMVVHVARRLSAEGARVTVFGPLQDIVVDRGVVWRPLSHFDPEAPCDVLISHRTAHLARRHNLGARKHFAWLHDSVVTNLTEDYEDANRHRLDGYLLLSGWQEDRYAAAYGVRRDQMIRVPNAPDDEDVPGDEAARDPHRAVYASAPYRGLSVLVKAWPLVRARVPDAELHVCNDYVVHDGLARQYPELRRLKDEILAHKDDPGIVWHGRVNGPQLREHFQKAGVLVYPCTFNETSCRTAIRAMACGCEPVYRPLAALEETVGPFGISVPGDDPSQPEYLKAFADRVADRMLAPPTAEHRQAMSEEVRDRLNPWPKWREIVGLAPRGPRVPRPLAEYHAEIGMPERPEVRL